MSIPRHVSIPENKYPSYGFKATGGPISYLIQYDPFECYPASCAILQYGAAFWVPIARLLIWRIHLYIGRSCITAIHTAVICTCDWQRTGVHIGWCLPISITHPWHLRVINRKVSGLDRLIGNGDYNFWEYQKQIGNIESIGNIENMGSISEISEISTHFLYIRNIQLVLSVFITVFSHVAVDI